MAEAFRRLLWSVPLLGALTVGLFYLLSSLPAARAQLALPLFINNRPQSAEIAAKQALAKLFNGTPGAEKELLVLGGAALPTILSALPVRKLSERRRIAEVLWPLSQRMGFTSEDILLGTKRGMRSFSKDPNTDEKLYFWEQFRDDHATDLTPLAVQRLVKRAASRSSQLRQRELRTADTYALPYLVAALGRVSTLEDIKRCSRLVDYISHASEQDFQLKESATLPEAQLIVTKIRRFWDKNGAKWTSRSPVELVAARLLQTEYVVWLVRSLREITRIDHNPLSLTLLKGSVISAPLIFASLLGLFALGPLVASLIVIVLLTIGNFRLERFGLRLILTLTLVILSAWTVRHQSANMKEMLLLALFTGAALGTFILQRELTDRLDWRTYHILNRRRPIERVLAVARWIGPAIATFLPMALMEAVAWLMCMETAANVSGIGALSVRAVITGDVELLMIVGLSLATLTMLLQLVADLVLGDFDERKLES